MPIKDGIILKAGIVYQDDIPFLIIVTSAGQIRMYSLPDLRMHMDMPLATEHYDPRYAYFYHSLVSVG